MSLYDDKVLVIPVLKEFGFHNTMKLIAEMWPEYDIFVTKHEDEFSLSFQEEYKDVIVPRTPLPGDREE